MHDMREYRMYGTYTVNVVDEKCVQNFSLGNREVKENCTDRQGGRTIFT